MPMQPTCLRHSQNALRSPALIAGLLARSSIRSTDLVLEIGPGRGAITELLASRCRQVLAVEKDLMLAVQLKRRFAHESCVVVHAADILRFPLPRPPYKVFANIPFNATAAIVRRLIDGPHAPEDSYLVVQREAAWRFMGRPAETMASVLLKPWFEPAIVYRFRRRDFDPAPQVESVLLRLRKRGPPLVESAARQEYRDFVVYAFTTWHPSLLETLVPMFGRTLCHGLWRALALDLEITPSAVPFQRWVALYERLAAHGSPRTWQAIQGSEERLALRQAGLQRPTRTRIVR